ncbi:hypothetical protein ACWO80_003471 [Vibrio cholerae]
MKAAITTTNHYVTTPEQLEKTIPAGSIVIIREQGRPESDSLVAHELCGGFHAWNRDLKPIEKEVQEFLWLDPCPSCGCARSYVEVDQVPTFEIRQGSKVHCAACQQKGIVEVYDLESLVCDWL